MFKVFLKVIKFLGLSGMIVMLSFFFFYNRYLFSISPKVKNSIPFKEEIVHPDYLKENAKARKFFRKLTYDWGLPSLSVAIAKKREVIYSAAFGFKNLGDSSLASPALPYRIHSISKVLTSTLIAELLEKEELALTDTVQKILTGYFTTVKPFTIEQLLSHRSGIRHYNSDEDLLNKTYYPSATATLERFEKDNLLFTPNSGFSYSSYGYNVLGAILEKVYDTTFQAILKERISQRINLEQLRPYNPNERIKYYELDSLHKVFDSPVIDESVKFPSGGLEASPTELVRFGISLLKGDIINEQTFKLFTSVPAKNRLAKRYYALGWETSSPPSTLKKVVKSLGNLISWKVPHTVGISPMIFHQGGSFGGMSFLVLYPEYDLIFAFTTNGNGNLRPIYKMPMMGLAPYFKK